MLVTAKYNRENALLYAREWALMRNPLFTNYSGIGGDCTNFASQVVYAGSCQMNYTADVGWYYISDTQRSAAWTGVEFFYNFITQNKGVGPFGREVFADEVVEGDIIQLANETGDFYHTLVVIGSDSEGFRVASHSDDYYNRALITYNYASLRYIHIDGVRLEMTDSSTCFNDLIAAINIGNP